MPPQRAAMRRGPERRGARRAPRRLLLGARSALEVAGAVEQPRAGGRARRAAIDSGAARGCSKRSRAFGSAAARAPGRRHERRISRADGARRAARACCRRRNACTAGRALARSAPQTAAAPPLAPDASGFDLIAELKLRSPAPGQLKGAGEDIASTRRGATRAAAPRRFRCSPSRSASTVRARAPGARAGALRTLAGHVPAMRKDFLVDPYQVCSRRGWRRCRRGTGDPAHAAARESCRRSSSAHASTKLFVLLEAFDEADMQLRMEGDRGYGARRRELLVGVNCRDLATLKVVPAALRALAPRCRGCAARRRERRDQRRGCGAGARGRLPAGARGQRAHAGPRSGALAAAMLGAGRAGRGCARCGSRSAA
jgi:indole-3-glycerol phosphate synthase